MGLKIDDIFIVGFMPCTAKKMEAARPQLTTEGHPDCDISVTTKEIAALFKEHKITFSVEQEEALKKTKEVNSTLHSANSLVPLISSVRPLVFLNQLFVMSMLSTTFHMIHPN